MKNVSSERAAPYAIVTPVRDERSTLCLTAASVLSQSRLPLRWVVVDDGSSDGSWESILQLAARLPWLRPVRLPDRGAREPGPGVVAAFARGLAELAGCDWAFVAKLDADVLLPGSYYQTLLEAFAADPQLGIASGVCLTPYGNAYRREASAHFHTRGPCKVYRRQCLEAIGGLRPTLGWDGLDGYDARRLGFRTRALDELQVLHLRPTHTGDGPLKGPMRAGRGAWRMRYSPAYLLARALNALPRAPLGVGAAGLLLGYLWAALRGEERLADGALARYLRAEQHRRLLRLGRRLPEDG